MKYRDTKTPYIPPKSTFGGEHLGATGMQCGITCEAGVLKILETRFKNILKNSCFWSLLRTRYWDTKTPYILHESTFDREHLEAMGV